MYAKATAGIAALALLLAEAPAGAQAPPQPAPTQPASPDCPALAAERTALQAEHRAVKQAIADIALGRNRRHRPVKAGDVAGAAAGAAAGLFLPLAGSLLVGAGTAAARKSGRKKAAAPDPGPDVPALIERQRLIEARLAELAASPCPAAPPPASGAE
jgi:hypothetical protein